MMELRDIKINEVCVIGLGNVGLPTAQHIQSKGIEVVGIDINDARVTKARSLGISAVNSMALAELCATGYDAFVICVGTGISERGPDLRAIYKVCADIRGLQRKPKIVSFESTLYPGTARTIARDIFNNEIPHVFVCPHRWWSKNPERYGVAVPRMLGSVYDSSRKVGYDFYFKFLEIPVKLTDTVETAELCKIVENGRRYVDIAYSEAIKMLCDEYGIDFEEVRKAVNTHFAHDMKEARDGIGGECLPLAIEYLEWMKHSVIGCGAISTDAEYIEHVKKETKNDV
jgi:nucleotide sugar dehydrogenase